MKTFRELVETEMSVEKFIESITKNFHSHFPNGYINISESNSFGTHSLIAKIGMIGNTKDNTNGIAQNDKMWHTFIMFEDAPGVYSFKGSGKIYINPGEGSYNAMDSVKTKMGNNSKITLEKADIKMKKFFKKLSGLMKDNIDNIYGVEKIDKKYLIIK